MYEHIIFPDYQGRNIANLMQTLASVRGGDVGLYSPLTGLEAQPLANDRNVVMLVNDGLGYEYLSQYPDSQLYRHLLCHARFPAGVRVQPYCERAGKPGTLRHLSAVL